MKKTNDTDERMVTPVTEAPPFMADYDVMVIGGNGYWARGTTLSEALQKAYRPTHYVAYLSHRDAYVDQINGALYSPAAYPSRLIDTKLPKGKKAI